MGIVIVEQEKKVNWVKEIMIIIVITIMASIGWAIPYFQATKKMEEIQSMKERYDSLVNYSNTFKQQLPLIQDNIKKIKAIYSQLNTLKLTLNESVLQRFILVEVPHILPPEAWMNNMSVNFDSKTISFNINIVGTRDKVLKNSAQLLDNINSNIVFKNPKITGISLQEKEGEIVSSFSVEITFDYSTDIIEKYYKRIGGD